jgi:hypothetical protein
MRTKNPVSGGCISTQAWWPFLIAKGERVVTIPDKDAEATDVVQVALGTGGAGLGGCEFAVSPGSGYAITFQNKADRDISGKIVIIGTVI